MEVADCGIAHLCLHSFGGVRTIHLLYPYLCGFTDLVVNIPLRLVDFTAGGYLRNNPFIK